MIEEEMVGQFEGLDLSYTLTEEEFYNISEYNNFVLRIGILMKENYNQETGEYNYKKEDFLVTNELQDEYGYPNIAIMTQLSEYLWHYHSDYFDENNNYWWTCTPEEALWQCADLWRIFSILEEEL